mgnify:CR=1 FL=1
MKCFTDETVYNGTCSQIADTCAYPNAACGTDGLCGCEDGLTYNETYDGCCKCCFSSLYILECRGN